MAATNGGTNFDSTGLPRFAPLKKSRSWKSKAALAIGVGVPLGLLALSDPVAADPFGSPHDGDSHQDSGSNNSGSSGGDTGEDNNGEGTNKEVKVDPPTPGPVASPAPQSDDITKPGFQITAAPAAQPTNFVEVKSGNGHNDEDHNDGAGVQLAGDPNDVLGYQELMDKIKREGLAADGGKRVDSDNPSADELKRVLDFYLRGAGASG